MISLEVDFVNIYYNLFNNTEIILIYLCRHIAILNCAYMIPRPSRPTTQTVYFYSTF